MERGAESGPCTAWIIANPRSGRGRGAERARAVAARLKQLGTGAEIRWTEAPGHATDLARDAAAAGVEAVAVVGGDGTVRDTAEGLAATPAQSRPPLAILPCGTGNDLARTLGIPRDPLAAADLLRTGALYDLDLWRWNDRLFVTVAGVGLDAAVARTVNERLRGVRGTLAYVLGALLTLPRFNPVELRIQARGESDPEAESPAVEQFSGRVMLVAFANARSYGGGMLIAPGADPGDGLLDVVVVEPISKLELLRALPRVFRGTHLKYPYVRTFRAAEVDLEPATAALTTLDGELLGGLPAAIRHAGTRLRVFVPRGDAR